MIKEILEDAQQRMDKTIVAFKSELSKLRTGRAHPSLLSHLSVDYYGVNTPLTQVANIAVEDARTLSVTPWEKNMVQVVEKAIMTADLGLNPATNGMVIRVPLPPLTEERRKQLVKVVREEAEKAKVGVRNIRRDGNQDFKDLLKSKDISEDESHDAEDNMQKLTDKYVKVIDSVCSDKEKDLMAV